MSAPIFNLSLYAPEIDCKTSSMISGKREEVLNYRELPSIPVIDAWLADDDLQFLKVCSTNIGFVREFQKRAARTPQEPQP